MQLLAGAKITNWLTLFTFIRVLLLAYESLSY